MQSIALQAVLIREGHEPYLDAQLHFRNSPRTLARLVKQLLKSGFDTLITPKMKNSALKNYRDFAVNHLNTTEIFGFFNRPQHTMIDSFDFFIAGSDQVWRPAYSNVERGMFDFLGPDTLKYPRLAYAASFGLDTAGEFNPDLLARCKPLLKRFQAISVREDTGVSICDDNFDIAATHVLDPTLLLTKDFYESFLSEDQENKLLSSTSIHTIFLDKNQESELLVEALQDKTGFAKEEFLPPEITSRRAFLENPNAFLLPSPALWLAFIRDAGIIVTDSYHVAIFSIIFKKTFFVVRNPARGNARLESLLSLLGLDERLLTLSSQLDECLNKNINWDSVEGRLRVQREISFHFLRENLTPKLERV